MPEPRTPRRGPAHGVDPARPLTLTVDGAALPALAGDSVASALLAAGRLAVAPSIYLSRRGPSRRDVAVMDWAAAPLTSSTRSGASPL